MSLLAFSTPQSAQAQTSGGHSWQIVYTQTGTWGYADRDMPTTGQSTGYNGAWPTTGNGYEIGGGGQINGSLTNATITATLTWIPATGKTLLTDPPPSPLNIIEYGYASCATNWGSPDMPDPSSAVADDGLGDAPPVSSSNGYNTWTVTSQGYHAVQKDASSGTVTVTCSPSASNPSSSYLLHSTYPNYYYWDWTQGLSSVSFTVYPVTPDLSGTTPDDSGNLDILVGQGCSASLSGIPSALLNNTANPPTYFWTVTGTTFQDWGPSSPLFPDASYFIGGYGPSTNLTAHWYWNDPRQTPETVTCAATATPPTGQGSPFTVTVTQKVTVYVPGWTATGTGTYMQVNTKAPQDPEYELWGNMSWDATVTTPTKPAFGQGTLELVQITTPNDSYTTYTQPVQNRSDPYNGITGLDTQYPVSAAIESVPYADGDNPGLPLTSSGSTVAGSAEFQPTFIDYLMYLPPGSDVKWVPIAAFAWSTSGNAAIPISGNWSDYVKENFSDSAGTISPSARTSFKALNTHPSWTQVVTTVAY